MDKAFEGFAAARRASGMTGEEAASICGITRPTYLDREACPGKFRLEELMNLYDKMSESGKTLLSASIRSLFLPL